MFDCIMVYCCSSEEWKGLEKEVIIVSTKYAELVAKVMHFLQAFQDIKIHLEGRLQVRCSGD